MARAAPINFIERKSHVATHEHEKATWKAAAVAEPCNARRHRRSGSRCRRRAERAQAFRLLERVWSDSRAAKDAGLPLAPRLAYGPETHRSRHALRAVQLRRWRSELASHQFRPPRRNEPRPDPRSVGGLGSWAQGAREEHRWRQNMAGRLAAGPPVSRRSRLRG